MLSIRTTQTYYLYSSIHYQDITLADKARTKKKNNKEKRQQEFKKKEHGHKW